MLDVGRLAFTMAMALTGNLIVRQQVTLVRFLKHFQAQYIESPLIWRVGFQRSDFLADGNGAYNRSVFHEQI